MKKLQLGTNFAVFVLFFGLALIEAIRSKNFLSALLFVILGLIFLHADNKK